MSKTIDQLLDALVAREGGYVDHPSDRGGPTKYGITEQVARAHGYQASMRDLHIDRAKEIYRTIYWERPGFEAVARRMPALAEELFDTGVNMGPKVAAVFLQRALNVLNRGASDYPDIATDGDIGPMTLNAIDRLKAKRGVISEKALVQATDALQGARYIDIAEKNPSQEAFAFGWLTQRVGPLP